MLHNVRMRSDIITHWVICPDFTDADMLTRTDHLKSLMRFTTASSFTHVRYECADPDSDLF